MDSFRIAKNEFFHVGDDDNAELIYPYFDKEYNVYESMLNDAAILFGFSKKTDYHFDLRNYILFGDEGMMKYEKARSEADSRNICKLYTESGYFIVKDERVRLLFDVGEIGLLPSMSHGHSDILSIVLYIDGKPILVDCGSYQYNAHYKKQRNYFHGVHSHNTVSIDKLDQAVPSSGMFWLSNPRTSIISYSENVENPFCTVSHDGYVRKELHVTHQRKVEYRKNEKEILICDMLTADKEHELSYYLHFHPDVNVKHEGARLIVGEKVIIENSLFEQGKVIRGDEDLPLGWYSKQYDDIEPTCTFVLRITMNQAKTINTQIKF